MPGDSSDPDASAVRQEDTAERRRTPIAFAAALTLALALVAAPRAWQWSEWTGDPSRHFAGDVVVASADSYHWFRVAREIASGGRGATGRDALRAFPDGMARGRESLLPVAMALLADALDTSVYRAGMAISLVLGVLFAIPLGLYFARWGSPAAGIVAIVVGGLSPAVLQRTSVYRVDTDGGNLLLMWIAALCLLELLRADLAWRRLLWAGAAGLAVRGLCAWYAQPGFLWVYGATLLLCAVKTGQGGRRSLALLAVFAVCGGPLDLAAGARDIASFVDAYVVAGIGGTGGVAASFPDVLDEIHELQRLSPSDTLAALLGPAPLALLGLVGFGLLAARDPEGALPLLPVLALGGLGVVWAMRFLMYLAPFVGAGLGWLLVLALRRLGVHGEGRAAFAGLAVGILLLPGTAAFDEPRPRIDAALLESLQVLREKAPAGAVAVAPWNHGYLLMDVTGLATFNDGRAPMDPVVEQLLSMAFVSPFPSGLPTLTTYLASRSRADLYSALERVGGQRALLAEIGSREVHGGHPIVVVFTERQLRQFSHVLRKATWDFERRRGSEGGYDVRQCTPEPPAAWRCGKEGRPVVRVDAAQGSVDGRPVATRWVRVRGGVVVEEREFARPAGVVLQLVESSTGPPHTLHVLDPLVFTSNFNQMFVLGRHDPKRFELLVDRPPHLRAYRSRLQSVADGP